MPNWRELNDTAIEFMIGKAVARTTTRQFGTVKFTDIVYPPSSRPRSATRAGAPC